MRKAQSSWAYEKAESGGSVWVEEDGKLEFEGLVELE
jgi:hypothetical protein